MKKLAIYCLFVFIAFPSFAQYYLRGEVKDEKNQSLPNVNIYIHSAKALFHSGAQGSFGITVRNLYDSVSFSLDGFVPQTLWLKATDWQTVILKFSAGYTTKVKQKLISITKDLKENERYSWFVSDETYFQLVENEFVDANRFPNTGFTLNVNKASYSNVRRFINMNSRVPPDAVRVEELVNYFNLQYKEPDNNQVFGMRTRLTSCPWNEEEQLLFLNINAKKLALEKVPPGNFVFLIDVSGSMDMPNRLPLLKAAFQAFVKNLRDIDTVSIVMYGGTVGIWLQPTSGAEKVKIIRSIEELTASGDTPGESAIRTAYKLAESTFIKGGNNRVILATDGDFNVGETSEKAMDELITKMKQTGVYLTCLGVGMGNFKDSKLQILASKGNGNYAYLDDIMEAEKVLVKELTQTFYAVADDVFMNVRFNPAVVKEYRLIGFDNRRDAIADEYSELEGGEIGSGASILAIFEIVPVNHNKQTIDTDGKNNVAEMNLRYSLCNDTSHSAMAYTVPGNFVPFNTLDKELRFATAVTMFALKLKQSKFVKNADWEVIVPIAYQSADPSDYLQKQFLDLLEKAQKIYPEKKKKKKRRQ